MLFPVYEMLAYFSRHMRIVPGDILATGTPPGVGLGKNRSMAVRNILECGCRAVLKSENFEYAVRLLYLIRFFRTFGAASKPLRSANPLSTRE
jgi:2-keto-4-pentenoate hydratase/2-oxohepta-3-ene-1,7-dioic acid hydratase in catechol pathway